MMAGKAKDSLVLGIRKCPRCGSALERSEIAGDERKVVVANVCWNCGWDSGEHVELKRK